MNRCGGVLMHISSLPGEYAIGTLGKGAREFIDFLRECGFGAWQVLPCGPCDDYNSPYSGKSAFAGNIYFIDPEILMDKKLLSQSDVQECKSENIYVTDYEFLKETREKVFRRAFMRLSDEMKKEVLDFCRKNSWAEDYALFCALKEENALSPWYEWDDSLKLRNKGALEKAKTRLAEDVFFYEFLQDEFFSQ